MYLVDFRYLAGKGCTSWGNVFYTLGQYDVVILYEAPSEKATLGAGLAFVDKAVTETLVANPIEDAKAPLNVVS
jgi:uncharacterized protein with GYD domain